MLEIVDENDNVIGTASRQDIHAQGLLHREINVHFVTPQGEIIFQRRSKTKDTFPNLLDAAAGGHVEIGDSYEETAVKEILEETGLNVSIKDLVLIDKTHTDTVDSITKMRNNAYRVVYGYIFKGALADLQIEANAAEGFEAFPIRDIYNLPDDEKKQFISRYTNPEQSSNLYQKLLSMVTS